MKKLFLILLASPILAFAQAPSDTLKDVRPFTTHALELLMAREPGVEVISTTGEPGMTPTIHVRGASVIAGLQPVFIVDGMRVRNLDGVVPEFIESIEVLKDASAMGIYGADAANGAIVVTTRRATQKGFHASYEFAGGLQSLAHEPKKMSLEEWNSYNLYNTGEYIEPYQPNPETTFLHKHTIHTQYGAEKWSAYMGLSLLDNNGPYAGRYDTHRRFAASWSAEYHPLNWLTLETTGRWTRNLVNQAPKTWLRNYLTSVPVKPIYYGFTFSTLQTKMDNVTEADIQGRVIAEPYPNLYLRAFGGVSHQDEVSYTAEWDDGPTVQDDDVTADYGSYKRSLYQAGLEAEWNRQWKNHGLRLYAGFHWTRDYLKSRGMTEISCYWNANNVNFGDDNQLIDSFIVPFLDMYEDPSASSSLVIPSTGHHYFSSLGKKEQVNRKETSFNVNYNWKKRYFIDFSYIWTAERKGIISSGYGVPAIAPTWVLSEEPLLRRILPSWWKNWSLKGSWSRATHYVPLFEQWTAFEQNTEHLISLHWDITTSASFLAGNTQIDFSAARFVKRDGLFQPFYAYLEHIPPVTLSIINRGFEFAGKVQGKIGQLRYDLSPWVTFYNNYTTADSSSSYHIYYWSQDYRHGDGKRLGVVDAYPEAEYSSVFPEVTGGFNLKLGWKQWQFTLLAHGDSGQTIYHKEDIDAACRYYSRILRSNGNWTGNLYTADFTKSQYSILPGDFFRIDQIRLDYALPLRKVNLNFYASLENWFLFTDHPGSDPEMALAWDGIGVETAYHPSTRRTIFGLSLSF